MRNKKHYKEWVVYTVMGRLVITARSKKEAIDIAYGKKNALMF